MKSLTDFINERLNESQEEQKSFTFDFEGIENKDELLKSLAEYPELTIDGSKVTVNVVKGADLEAPLDMLQQTIDGLRKSMKSNNDEQYAQKTKALATTLSNLFDYQDEIENPEEEEEDKKEDDKKEEEEDKKEDNK